ncbi:uncharacterized protein M421DRAFT_375746 [Didymella exigua CBS 183.55]|uniref:Uncharacterized protein n=1 Tax=Didymella exigua CBS 183.55 TaxID=1150837 RepID=A0A6A5RU20_9PLEO|nr:uncharacterized protein M421DRAFT_375746 [Didymella exigua CBS 183.55]KAF1930518.1 hypothetical protein M421DRAFT_375746 [Didymella exigua CBS 183.55]
MTDMIEIYQADVAVGCGTSDHFLSLTHLAFSNSQRPRSLRGRGRARTRSSRDTTRCKVGRVLTYPCYFLVLLVQDLFPDFSVRAAQIPSLARAPAATWPSPRALKRDGAPAQSSSLGSRACFSGQSCRAMSARRYRLNRTEPRRLSIPLLITQCNPTIGIPISKKKVSAPLISSTLQSSTDLF